ncbi:integrase catalytic domain-containing protein [Trichonephila clavipes]|nr:integrase catalytic domain-containing protein [Trichonephila clavipes]
MDLSRLYDELRGKLRALRAPERTQESISNPTLEESKQNSCEDALDDFQQKLTILPNGRNKGNLRWSDSEVALWIREQGNWSVFVANRVKGIRELTQFQSWRHVPSNMNMADLLSRGCTPQKMLDSKWWEGPRWLKNNREQWPANEINCEPKDVILEKRKSELVNVNISEELVPCDTSRASEFIVYRVFHALRRFIARRTQDQKLYIQITELIFVGTNSELKKNLDWDNIMQETDIKPIKLSQVVGYLKWKFNPQLPLGGGGWWERLVRVIKELLKRTLGKAILTYEELLTVLCDCEAVVNFRPLTYVSEDPNDLIPLTPSLFLNGKSSYDTIDLDLSEFSKFQKRIKYRRKLIHDFRSRFRKEYLGQLRQKRPGKPGHDVKVGDVVMIEEPSKKRVYWPLGKVISLLPGRDGKVRT